MNKSSFFRITAALWLSLMASACSARQSVPLGQIPVPPVPDATQRQTSMSMVQQYASGSGYTVVRDEKARARVQRVVDRLSTAAGATTSYPVTLVDAGEEVNAAAVNGASIVVHTSLLRKVPNDDELATVLGHEMAHIAAQHHNDNGQEERASTVSVGSSLVGLAATVGASVAGAGSGAADMAGDLTSGVTETVGTGAYVLSYSRDMEREADQIGLMIMAKAGYNPQAAVTFWQNAAEIFGSADGSDFFSTHPASGDRVERLEAAMPKALEYYAQAKAQGVGAAPVGKKKSAKKK